MIFNKKHLIMPAKETNQQQTFDKHDYGNLTTFANNLVNLIEVEAAVNEGSGVISLDAKFGMGKTHFLQMFETHLKNQEFECFFIDAWRNDFYHSPLLTIIFEFINYLDKNKEENAKIIKQLKTIATISVGTASFVINKISQKIAGFGHEDTINNAKKIEKQKKAKGSITIEQILENYQ